MNNLLHKRTNAKLLYVAILCAIVVACLLVATFMTPNAQAATLSSLGTSHSGANLIVDGSTMCGGGTNSTANKVDSCTISAGQNSIGSFVNLQVYWSTTSATDGFDNFSPVNGSQTFSVGTYYVVGVVKVYSDPSKATVKNTYHSGVLTLTVAPAGYTLTVTKNTGVASIVVNGQTFTQSGTMSVAVGATVNWSATAATGYTLSQSSGSFAMNSNNTIAPTASVSAYTLTITKNTGISTIRVVRTSSNYGGGSIGSLASGATIYYGDVLEVTATASSDYTLDTYKQAYTVTGNVSVAPTATPKNYILTVTVTGRVSSVTVQYGSTSKTFTESGTAEVPYGTTVSWSAVAKTGSAMDTASGSVTMYGPQSIAPTASAIHYTVTVNVNAHVQSVRFGDIEYTSSTTFQATYGAYYTWQATAEDGYTLSSSSGSFTVTGSLTISPTATLKSFTLSVTVNNNVSSVNVQRTSSPKANATIGAITNGATIYWGDVLTVSATPCNGFEMHAYQNEYTVSNNIVVAPVAKANEYKLLKNYNTGIAGIVVERLQSPNKGVPYGIVGNGETLYYGDVLRVTVTAARGYTVDGNSVIEYTVSDNVTITPTATPKTFTVSISSYEPEEATRFAVRWTLEWASGVVAEGSTADYVEMIVADDGMSVTLTFKKDFHGNAMVLRCTSVYNENAFEIRSVTCG